MKRTKALLLLLSSIPLFAQVQAGAIDTVAGNGTYGFSGDRGVATRAQVDAVYGLAVDSLGVVYIADTWNHRIRKVTPDGTITTVAGTGEAGYSGDSGAATAAKLSYPRGLATDLQDVLYISDSGNSCVRRVGRDGIITTVAGTGVGGYSGDGGQAKAARLFYPRGIAVDAAGTLYIADSLNFRVRKVTAAGIISTIAGTGVNGSSGESGLATQMQVGMVQGVAADFQASMEYHDGQRWLRSLTFTATT